MMAFLERPVDQSVIRDTSREYRPGGLGATMSIEHLLSPTALAELEARRLAAAQQAVVTVPAPVIVSSTPCDGPSQAAAAAEAQARGGCVDVTLCDNRGRVVAVNRQCWDDPVVKAALVDQVRADEIEAGALERVVEMASAVDANSTESEDRAKSEAEALIAEVDEYHAQAAQDDAEVAAALRARDRLRNLAHAARARLGVSS